MEWTDPQLRLTPTCGSDFVLHLCFNMFQMKDRYENTQVRNSCSLMHSECVYPITALIKPQCFPSDIIKVLWRTLMGSVLTGHGLLYTTATCFHQSESSIAQEVTTLSAGPGGTGTDLPCYSLFFIGGINTTLPMSLSGCCHEDNSMKS